MTREEALDLLHKHMKNKNLRRHCYAVAQVMEKFALHFKNQKSNSKKIHSTGLGQAYQKEEINPDSWWIAGLIHDADYELTKDNPKKHTHLTVKWLKELKADKEIIDAVLAHGWGYVSGNPEPSNYMQWSLYCCDELTGFIVAVVLVRPNKKLSAVTVDSVLKKFPQKAFAAGVHRDQIKLCEEKLGIELSKFVEITLTAMQGISDKLGL